jgi:hypothetical protein
MKSSHSQGYTLVETVLYCALVVLLLGAIVNAGVLLARSHRQIIEAKNVQVSALSVMDQVTRNIRNAESIDGSETVYGSANGSLQLRSLDSVGTTHTIKFYLSSGQVVVNKDGVLFGPLTDARSSVTSLVFYQINTGNSLGVKVELTVEGKKFYQTAMLRGSYQ